ncbi:esterase [Buchnera aphidicola (Nipponaphis monzeni)]|uniref:Esterase n=1 Tax=Buchnera aphidicola (Nipponaphis monzeni) TaxID=2495405 RepID=A0A455TA50_9GAMM|nr:acyl-CoA thioester hydrolase YciA [Buchnera aphidicola]BBI01226.1 esterase [Buchnera aphidicola (Nipponaphis monzeni)]
MLQLTYQKPRGKIVLRTLATPACTNVNGNICGGWIMSQMDIGGAILAKEISKGQVVTLKINQMIFIKPINVGDLVSCYAQLVNTGNSSITINVEMWIKKITSKPIGIKYCTTKSTFIFVAINSLGKPRKYTC